jgi:hypothetical protein
VIKKTVLAITTMITATSTVTPNLTPEELVKFMDVAVASKYGNDLTNFTYTITDEVCSTLVTFKTDLQKLHPEYFDMIPYPQGFQVHDLAKLTGDGTKTMYEHIGQFLAQDNDMGITDVHKIRMFPLSLTGAAFNWFTSLPRNSIDSWVSLEQKFHDYFYNGEVELRLSNLTSLRQKYTQTISDYLRQFREVRNWCYKLIIAEKDLADLAFAALTPYLRDKLDEQEFSDTNLLLQHALPYENHGKSSQFRDNAKRTRKSTMLTSWLRRPMMRRATRFV